MREPYGKALRDSCRYGLDRLEEIVPIEAASRKLPEPLVRRYFTEHIRFEFGPQHAAGLAEYLKRALALDKIQVPVALSQKPTTLGGHSA